MIKFLLRQRSCSRYSTVFFFDSLPNFSNDVRWSVDLRWQSPREKWGFYDIAEGVVFRDRLKGNVVPDWKKFLSVNRKEIWQRMHFDKVILTSFQYSCGISIIQLLLISSLHYPNWSPVPQCLK